MHKEGRNVLRPALQSMALNRTLASTVILFDTSSRSLAVLDLHSFIVDLLSIVTVALDRNFFRKMMGEENISKDKGESAREATSTMTAALAEDCSFE